MRLRATLLALASSLPLVAVAPALAEQRPLLQEGKETLYQRILTTPGCHLTQEAGGSGAIFSPHLAVFTSISVVTKTAKTGLK